MAKFATIKNSAMIGSTDFYGFFATPCPPLQFAQKWKLGHNILIFLSIALAPCQVPEVLATWSVEV